MSQRYFCDEPISYDPGSPSHAVLAEGEAHHFLHVMRGRVGDRVTLFDGSGAEFNAGVTETSRRAVTLAVLSREEVDREPRVSVTLGVALPKGDRQKALVDMLTQLGVARLVPLQTERSVAAPKASGLEKLRRVVVEASKQCGRNRLMRIEDPAPLQSFLTQTDAATKRVAHPYGPSQPLAEATGPMAIAIGPEGGFTDQEVGAAVEAGWPALSLGRSVLRIETAAVAAATLATA